MSVCCPSHALFLCAYDARYVDVAYTRSPVNGPDTGAPFQLHYPSPPYADPTSRLARPVNHYFPFFLRGHRTLLWEFLVALECDCVMLFLVVVGWGDSWLAMRADDNT